MGAMLSQNVIRKSDQTIMYSYRLLNKAKYNYNTTKRKALAMVLLCTSYEMICWAINLSFM
jgi:hypothetical protein